MNNQLKNAYSPYLLQHANNPVFWQFWSDENLELAKNQNKLLIISIGYSACHWCHVMEKECFEDEDVADVMNKHFTSFKIDREELPAVDAYYMQALQLMTNQGGWPLNIVALPNGLPIWGATYVSKSQWIDVLLQLQNLYDTNPSKMVEYADKLQQGIQLANNTLEIYPGSNSNFEFQPLLNNWIKSFDWQYGGYIKTPKFMMPTNLNFLFEYGVRYKNSTLIDYVDLTLTKMAYGGLFDVIEGGFSRYSVDHKWHIPHFEKMLYDNAQLLTTYSKVYNSSKDDFYKQVIHKTVQFVLTNWKSKSGGFYAAFDADSINREGKLEEGAYYFWLEDDLKLLIPNDEWQLFKDVFSINADGFWHEANAYVFFQEKDLEVIAAQYKMDINNVRQLKANWENTLLNNRVKRQKPLLDDKIITSWNAILLNGLLDASLIIDNVELNESIRQLASYLQFTAFNNKLGRVFKNDELYLLGVLEDYAFTIKAFIKLFIHTQNIENLNFAKDLLYQSLDMFYHETQGFFKSSENQLVGTIFDIEDNVIPSSNAIMAENLFLIGFLFQNEYFISLSKQMIHRVINQVQYASGYSEWLRIDLLVNNFEYIILKNPNINEINEVLQMDKFSVILNNTLNIPILEAYKNQNKKYQICNLSSCRLLTDDINQL